MFAHTETERKNITTISAMDMVPLCRWCWKIVNEYEYDEWGNILKQRETIRNDIKYSGEYYDSESGLYYLRARYYDPTIGRFISRDSYEGSVTNPLSLNLYTYCHNNPVNNMDPSGHITTEEDLKFRSDCRRKRAEYIDENILTEENAQAVAFVTAQPEFMLAYEWYAGYKAYKSSQLAFEESMQLLDKSDEAAAILNGAAKADIWKLSPTARGETIEAYLAKTDYADWGNIGATKGGYFPVIDFVDQASMKAVSLKTIDPNLATYANGQVNVKIGEYLNDLNRAITSTGPDGVPRLMDKFLDVRVPVGTKGMVDIISLTEKAQELGITLTIKEF